MGTISLIFSVITVALVLYALWCKGKAKKHKIGDGYVVTGVLSGIFAFVFGIFFFLTLV